MKTYQIIIPLFIPDYKNDTKKKLKEFCDWYIDIIPERLEILINTVKTDENYQGWNPDFSPDSLELLGKWFAENIAVRKKSKNELEEFYSNSPEWAKYIEIPDWDLSNKTYSLGIDIGMYISQVFIKNHPEIKWYYYLKGRKDDINYGKPVLEGFGKKYFNPMRMIRVLAYGLADKTENEKSLRKLYNIWIKFIK